jgi:hypothetical protein
MEIAGRITSSLLISLSVASMLAVPYSSPVYFLLAEAKMEPDIWMVRTVAII